MHLTAPNLMIFAAGLGTRMGRLTANRPKPLIEVGGKALIDHALGLADTAKVGRVAVNLHYRAEMLREHLAGRPEIALSAETDTILETGGGLLAALPLLGPDPVLTLNSDSVWTGRNPLSQLVAAWQPDRMGALLLLVPRDAAAGHTGKGDFDILPDGQIRRGTSFVYTGAQLTRTDSLYLIGETVFSFNKVWDRYSADGRLYGLIHDGGWCDVGRPESISVAERILEDATHV